MLDRARQQLHQEGALLRETAAPRIHVTGQGEPACGAEKNSRDGRIGGQVERLHADLVPHGTHRVVGVGEALRYQIGTGRITAQVEEDLDADAESYVAAVVPE